MVDKKKFVTKEFAYYFPIFFFITQSAGILFMALIFFIVVVYMGDYKYGYETKCGKNYHMVLAPLALVYINGQGMLLFRLMRNITSQTVKVLHTLVHTAAFLVSILAVYAMWSGKENPFTQYTEYQNTPTALDRKSPAPRPKYTPVPIAEITHFNNGGEVSHFGAFHSYLGYLTVLCVILAYFCGVFLHLLEVHLYYKDFFSGVHGFLGTYALVVATITSVSGVATIFNDREFFWFQRYYEYGAEYRIAFYCSLCGLTFSWVIVYLVTNPMFEWIPIGPI